MILAFVLSADSQSWGHKDYYYGNIDSLIMMPI